MNTFPFWVGLRYTRSSNQQKFLSLLSWLSLIGITLGVAALIIVMSVMKGFQQELEQRLLSVSAEVVIEGIDHQAFSNQSISAQIDWLESKYTGLFAAEVIGGDAVLKSNDRAQALSLRGVSEDRLLEISSEVTPDRLDIRYGIVIGETIASRHLLSAGDRVKVILPTMMITPFGVRPRERQFTVIGTFNSGSEQDSSSAFINIQDARKLYRLKPNEVHAIDFYKDPLLIDQLRFDAPSIAQELNQQFSQQNLMLTAIPWQAKQQQLYRAIKMEQFMIGFMLSLVIAVAAFNLIALLSMMVAGKRSDIAILQMMGLTPSMAVKIFLTQGLILSFVALAVGVVAGVVIALNISDLVRWFEQSFGFYIFDPSVFYITGLPSDLQRSDVVLVIIYTVLLSVLFCSYPAFRASKIKPVDAMAYH